MSRPCKNGTHIYKTGEKFYCLDCGADLRDTDTTAQLRLKITDTILNDDNASIDKNRLDDILRHIADYISQLELPEKKPITTKLLHSKQNIHIQGKDLGYNLAIDDVKQQLLKSSQELKS